MEEDFFQKIYNFKIEDLHVNVKGKEIIKGVKLSHIIESIKKDKEYKSYIDKINLAGFIERDVNTGFSGGEVKRTEAL
ncbi:MULTISPECIES: hypothetical protein [Caldisericum]|jgi:Fe-S cluster assembly ATPase SufC|uniref:Uncharacterized protein n=1 Tax=Caldisericum exile TaxID=693075 RepID=A0A2J6WFC2_9BACT|nr:MAG: hypothetical protein C0189_01470 [Caldisericum exile]